MRDVRSNAYERRALGDVCTLQRGFDLPTKNRNPGEYALVTSSGSTGTHDEAKVAGPGVVTGRSGSIGNVFFLEDDFWPLNTTLYVKDFHGNDERYVYYLLQFFDLGKFASGAGVPTLNRNHVHSEPVHVAGNLEEQKRIVAILDEAFAALDRARAHAEANLADAEELLATNADRIFTPAGDWTTHRLGSICSKIGSGATPKGGAKAYKSKGISLIRSLNVYDRVFRAERLAFLDEVQAYKLSSVTVEERDVLFNITGASITRCCIAPDSWLPARVNQHVAIIRPDSEILDPLFLCFYLTARTQKKRLLGTGEKGGSTRQAITKKQLEDLTVEFPGSMEDQKKTVRDFHELQERHDGIIKCYEDRLSDIADLRQSLLQKAFAGELS